MEYLKGYLLYLEAFSELHAYKHKGTDIPRGLKRISYQQCLFLSLYRPYDLETNQHHNTAS